jgi:hypothetical protein
MREQRIQWVALPGGPLPDGGLRVSVLVAPRLRTDERPPGAAGPTLASFPDFLNWPGTVAATTFAVIVGGATVPASIVGTADTDLWKALFPPETPVQPFAFDDYADRPFVTFSVRAVLGALRKAYAVVAAASPGELPPFRTSSHVEPQVIGLDRLLEEMRVLSSEVLALRQQIPGQPPTRIADLLARARGKAAARRSGGTRGPDMIEPLPLDGGGTVARHLARALFFHARPTTEPVEMPPDGAYHAARVDFHQMLSALGDHPWLMRRLGLVIDLRVDGGTIPTGTPSAPGALSVHPSWTSAIAVESADVLPRTRFVLQSGDGKVTFAAARRNPDPTAPPDAPPTGVVPLTPAFSLEQVDVDGAALKVVNLIATIEAALATNEPGPLDEPDRSGLPSLRTGGVSLVEADRAAGLQSMFLGHLDLNSGVETNAPRDYFAEDLVRGFRLDVFDARQDAWRSLHRRTVTAAAERFRGALAQQEDEGFFQVSLSSDAAPAGQAPDPNGPLYVHESLVTWDGWSLSAPRPGKAISRDPRAPADDLPETQPQRVTNDPFTAMGIRLDVRAPRGSLPRLRFGRGYRVRLRTVDLAGNGPTLEEADALMAAPGSAARALPAAGALRYMRFEPIPAPALVPTRPLGEGASLLRLVIRSNQGQTPDEYAAAFNALDVVTSGGHPGYAGHDERHVAAPKASFECVERHGMLDGPIGSNGSPPDAAQQAALAAAYEVARREKGSLSPVHPEEQLALPYLPDPLAAGAAIFGLPGVSPGEPFRVTFDADPWHEPRPFRLRLVQGGGAPQWDAGARLLTVSLGQAAKARIRIASLIDGSLDLMGILQWCAEELEPQKLDKVITSAKENRCWLVTPWHEVELVHAVQQPLMEPEVLSFAVRRGSDATWADLVGVLRVHPPSTEKIEVGATWTETVDNPALDDPGKVGPSPRVRSCAAEVFALPLTTAALGGDHVDPHASPYSLRLEDGILTFNTGQTERNDLPPPARHRFGDTKYRRVTYRISAASPFREDFPARWIESPALLSRTGAPQEVDVLNSAPPAAPKLLYVVPTQGWEEGTGEGGAVVRRRRGGLRVYLDRPWYSSGDGEMLGVVVREPPITPKAPAYPYVTLLGQDPVRAAGVVEQAATSAFSNADLVTDAVRLLGTSEQVRIAAFTPTFDPSTPHGKGAWFCDIDIETGEAYMPFVRLALVRYQPKSIAGCAVSRVVVADIVQKLPDRTLTVVRSEGQLQVTVAGPGYAAISGVAPRSDDAALGRVLARIERREVSVPDIMLAWKPIGETVLARTMNGNLATWTGTVPVPLGDGAPQRLAVIEEEHLAVEAQAAGQPDLATRVVYADVLGI